jgi:hypothetical protein
VLAPNPLLENTNLGAAIADKAYDAIGLWRDDLGRPLLREFVDEMLSRRRGPIATHSELERGSSTLQIGAGTAQDPRDRMESAVTLDCPTSGTEPARQEDDCRLHSDCS